MIKVLVPAVLALLAVMAATNPDEPAHARAMISHAKGACTDNGMVRALCGGLASLATLAVAYDDHLLFSTARIGDMKTIGALGRVVVVSE
jgi:hypothetical protein